MRVSELKKLLEQFDDNAMVLVDNCNEPVWCAVTNQKGKAVWLQTRGDFDYIEEMERHLQECVEGCVSDAEAVSDLLEQGCTLADFYEISLSCGDWANKVMEENGLEELRWSL